jgi:4-hydroxybenzoate polyprenyltransferase
MIWKRLRLTLEMIKFEHSVFALPFALTGALLAFRQTGFGYAPAARKVLWICLAMVGARSAAMAFNRLVDAPIDARNPRTRMRHLPTGLLSQGFAWSFVVISSVVFFLAAGALNRLCLRLAPAALALVFFYSFTKRFTSFSHLVLGFCLGVAPAAAWIAVAGSLDPRILWLTAAVTFWTAGFDIIYSCQDYEFDGAEGLFSIPGRSASRARAPCAHGGLPLSAGTDFTFGSTGTGRGRLHCSDSGVRAQPGETQRSLTGGRRLLHHERLRERVILSFLGC